MAQLSLADDFFEDVLGNIKDRDGDDHVSDSRKQPLRQLALGHQEGSDHLVDTCDDEPCRQQNENRTRRCEPPSGQAVHMLLTCMAWQSQQRWTDQSRRRLHMRQL